MIVIDASVAVEVLLEDRAGGPVRVRLAEEDELHAPAVLDVEVVRVLRKLAMRGQIAPEIATFAVAELTSMPINRHDHTGLIRRAWQLRDNLTAADAMYVALAEALGTSLLTGDLRLSRAPGIACEVELLAG